MILEGSRVIVTGASGGIGAATVRVLVCEGARVAALDVDDSRGKDAVASAPEGTGGTATYYHCDLSNRAEVDRVFDEAVAALGGLDALASLGAIHKEHPAEEPDDAVLNKVIGVNLFGTIYSNQAAFRHLKQAGGAILNTSSLAGVVGEPIAAYYSASKGGVAAWTRTAAKEWGRYDIRVNCIAPTADSPMYQKFLADKSAEERAAWLESFKAMTPLGRVGDPDTDVAPAIAWLISDYAKFITAQTIAIDGGLITIT